MGQFNEDEHERILSNINFHKYQYQTLTTLSKMEVL